MYICVAMCCGEFVHLRGYINVLQCVTVCCSVLQRVTVCDSVLQCVAVCRSVLHCVAVRCSIEHLSYEVLVLYTYIGRQNCAFE